MVYDLMSLLCDKRHKEEQKATFGLLVELLPVVDFDNMHHSPVWYYLLFLQIFTIRLCCFSKCRTTRKGVLDLLTFWEKSSSIVC